MSEWIKSYRTLEALDFDVLVGGHGTVAFRKQDITEGREYFEYLQHEVEGAMSRGLSLAQMREQLTLDRYKSWAHYAQLRPYNIEAAYHNLSIYK
jgi:glyoxylase-like metal-dependent hydrolase (beta-lactamase superfamily II)